MSFLNLSVIQNIMALKIFKYSSLDASLGVALVGRRARRRRARAVRDLREQRWDAGLDRARRAARAQSIARARQ
jgi:hypothetical protein